MSGGARVLVDQAAQDGFSVDRPAVEVGDGEALADRVHPRSQDSCADDPGAVGLEDGVERDGETRSAITDQEPNVLEPRAPRVSARLRACCTVQSPVGCAVMPPRRIRRVPCSMNTSTYRRLRSTVSTCRKSAASIPAAWACGNCRHVGPDRRGAGSMPAARRISHTVDGATFTPSFVSSPWIRRCKNAGETLNRVFERHSRRLTWDCRCRRASRGAPPAR
jgi:hypothetical protein